MKGIRGWNSYAISHLIPLWAFSRLGVLVCVWFWEHDFLIEQSTSKLPIGPVCGLEPHILDL